MSQSHLEQSSHNLADLKTTVTSRYRVLKGILCIAIVLFLRFAVSSYATGLGYSSALFLLSVAICIVLLLMVGELQMNSDGVTHSNLFQKSQMRWVDVDSVEADEQGGELVFCSRDRSKILSVLGPYFWSRREKEDVSAFLDAEMERRQIKLVQTRRALLTKSKNTRVS